MTDPPKPTLNEQTDVILAGSRPPRYDKRAAFLQSATSKIAKLIPEQDLDAVKAAYAATLVENAENRATSRARKLLRQIKRTGTLPLFWADSGADPIIVAGQRIRLDAATPDDMRLYESSKRTPTKARAEASFDTLDGAVFLANLADEKGDGLVWDAMKRMATAAAAEQDDDEDLEDDET